MFFVLVEGDGITQFVHLSINTHAHIAGRLQLRQFLAVFPFALADDGRHHQQAGFFRQQHDLVDHLLHGLCRNFMTAAMAENVADPGIEQAQVVIDFGHRTDGGAGVL